MKIKSIKLTNFRQFRDTKVEFSTDGTNNVSLIIGDNGSGKTTLAQAFRWCLYAETSFQDPCLLNQSKFMEMGVGDESRVSVRLEVLYKNYTYIFTRTRDYRKLKNLSPNAENVSLNECVSTFPKDDTFTGYRKHDGDTDTITDIITLNNIVRQVVPKTLSSYIFFDGERIASMSKNVWQAKANPEFKKAVETMLGLETWLQAVKHLGDEGSRNTVYANFHREYLKVAGKKAKSLETELDTLLGQNIELEKIKVAAEQQKQEYLGLIREQEEIISRNSKGAEKQNEMALFEEKARGAAKQKQYALDAMQKAFADNLFAFASQKLAFDTFELLKNVDLTDKNVPNVTSDTINALLQRGYCLCGTKLEEGSDEYQTLISLKKFVPPESISTVVHNFARGLSDLYTMNQKIDSLVDDLDKHAANVQRETEAEEAHLERVRAIEQDLQGGDFGTIVNNAQTLISQIRGSIGKEDRKFGAADSEILRNNDRIKDIRNQLQQTAKTGLEADIYARAKQYTSVICKAIAREYQSKEVDLRTRLQTEMQAIFKKINKQNMTLEIDDQYRTYSRVQGLARTELSQAESGSVTLSFIGGVLSLGKKLLAEDQTYSGIIESVPLVMDAPLSAFDKQKISSLCEIIPEISEQIIIFIKDTDGDIAKEHFNGRIGVHLRLTRSDNFNSSFTEEDK